MENVPPGTVCDDRNWSNVRINMWMSFKLADNEKRYSMPEKEMLAVVRALQECRWLILHSPHPIKVYTDHKGVVESVNNHTEVHGKLSRWMEILLKYDLEFVY